MTSCEPRRWDVWLCYLHFDDRPEAGKVRPVVVLEAGEGLAVVAKVTTAGPSPRFPRVPVGDWRGAGLRRPSFVQVDPLFEVRLGDLLRGRPLGALSPDDRAAVASRVS